MTTDPLLKVQVDTVAGTVDIRQSAIGAFMDCRRKFFWEYVRGLEPDYRSEQRPWKTTDIGSAFHAGIGAYYTEETDPLTAIEDYITENGWALSDIKDRDLVRIMVEGHIEDLSRDGGDVGETTIGVEVPVKATVLDVGVFGWDVTVHGQVDRLIETDGGLNIIDDWKTVGPLDSTIGHIQQLGRYALMVRSQTGWRADQVRTTQVRKVKRTGDGPFYARPEIALTEKAYRTHASNLRAVLAEIVQCLDEDGVWYEHVTTECSWKCRVEDICLAQQYGQDAEIVVDLGYREKGSA